MVAAAMRTGEQAMRMATERQRLRPEGHTKTRTQWRSPPRGAKLGRGKWLNSKEHLEKTVRYVQASTVQY